MGEFIPLDTDTARGSHLLSRRRALITGAFAAPAAILAPAAAIVSREPARGPKEGRMTISIGGRTAEVDTNDVPPVRIEVEPLADTGRTIKVAYVEPDEEADYLVLHHDGRLSITRISGGSMCTPMESDKARLAWTPVEAEEHYAIAYRVTVLGKVVA